MRIAMIGLRGVPAKYSGVETAVEEIGSRLVGQGHQVSVYCMAGAGGPYGGIYRGMNRIEIPTIKSKNLQMIVYSALSTLHAIRQGYDVIHLQALGPSTMALLCWLTRRPVVVTCHGLDYKREKWGLLARLYLQLGEYVSARFAREVITVSKSLKDHFQRVHGKRATYIPNGSREQARVELGEYSQRYDILPRNYVVFVGRLVECKRVDHLISAFRRVHTDLKLVIVGDGPTEIVSRLKAVAGDSNQIVFTGALHGAELAAIFSNASLFVLPSVLEGLPLALIEALAYDLPVVVSDIPENLEVVEDAGQYRAVVTTADDECSLTEGLERAIAEFKSNNGLSSGNARFVSDKYDWDEVSRQTLKAYERTLGA
ncbi:glycosyltransferase family 4 protein [Mesorhizobium sp. WSM2239]|uniref:Glycosyltransferase family 4 protein n=2 Tax=unclassified Mesorhizobium TaxID=325217 RepID=A0AAU8DIJ3_9HYPH